MSQHATPRLTRFLTFLLLFSLIVNLLPMTQVAQALSAVSDINSSQQNPGGNLSEIRDAETAETKYGIVAILVDEETWAAKAQNRRGIFSFLGNSKLSVKITRYAQDVQASLPWTKTVIVKVGPEDTPVEIQRVLEKYYFEGNDEGGDYTQLSGVVVIGSKVPLPVVNKRGHRFISMLPYTDFEEPSYLLDPATLDFIPNEQALEQQPEVWHGVIVPPLSGEAGVDLLAAYLDKNHGYHEGDAEYTVFDQRAFVGDFAEEEKSINGVTFASYKRWLKLWEEMGYYRYTNDLVEDIYLEMLEGVSPGDGLDNDQDGLTDEEAENTLDDDGDGLVDEDLGDGFFGIDNDGDCAVLGASLQDSNGDGRRCGPGDNKVDEDGFNDNNNDEDWLHRAFLQESDPDRVEKYFADQAADEDKPGDMNGDGCPGVCNQKNSRLNDDDKDGFPTAWEILHGFDPNDVNKPFYRVSKKTNELFGTNFATDEDGDLEAQAYLTEWTLDTMYGNALHDSCYDGGTPHPEWDDDGDFFCDEDGSTEQQIWANDAGVRNSIDCAYNDNDCDGTVDEDSEGLTPENRFDMLPDIQAKGIVEQMTSRYLELFEQPIGVWNRMVDGTGRYQTRKQTGTGTVNEYDSDVSLISKKDQFTYEYMMEVNDIFEKSLDEIIEEDLQKEIPLIAAMQIAARMEIGGNTEEGCKTNSLTEGSDNCLEFYNHSINLNDPLAPLLMATFEQFNPATPDEVIKMSNVRVFGQTLSQLYEANDPGLCTIYAGTNEEGGQQVEFNLMYAMTDKLYPGGEDAPDASGFDSGEIRARENCVADNLPYNEDIPNMCTPDIAVENVRALEGGHKLEDVDPDEIDVGFPACFEFREMPYFRAYFWENDHFSDWLSHQLRQFREGQSSDDAESYEDFLVRVEEERTAIAERERAAAGFTLSTDNRLPTRNSYRSMDILSADTSRYYSVYDFFRDLGWEERDITDDAIDTYIALKPDNLAVRIRTPEHGRGMDDVESITVKFNKIYFKADPLLPGVGHMKRDMNDSDTLSSVYKHVQPDNRTLNAQVRAPATPNLPIDATRRVSFMDAAHDPQEINYVNVFDASTVADVKTQLQTMANAVAQVKGGAAFENDVENFIKQINEEQLADALEWYRMNIDEKHKYVFTHYLGTDEPIVGESRGGYEVVSIIADGTPTELYYAFNGDKPLSDEDMELKYRNQEMIDAALEGRTQSPYAEYEGPGGINPIMIWDWIPAMGEWMEDIQSSISSFSSPGSGESVCGDPIELKSSAHVDATGDGVPDGAESTTSIRLTTDDNTVLQSGGKDSFLVTVSSRGADGSLNGNDSFSQVELEILAGDEAVDLQGNSTLTLTGGTASFALVSKEPGGFTVRAKPINRPGVASSNTLAGTVTNKFVRLSTYITERTGTETVRQTGDLIEFPNEAGVVAAVFDPKTGKLDLRGAEAELKEATSSKPTRALITQNGSTLGSIFLIPEKKTVSIGTGSEGVFVRSLEREATAKKTGDGVELYNDEARIGLVTRLGLIGVAEDYFLEFDNPGDINLYAPFHVVNSTGESLFTVDIQHAFETAEIQPAQGAERNFLSKLHWPSPAKAKAAIAIPDQDADLLDDLEEWTIGTKYLKPDTDIDSYLDGQEVFSGHDPLGNGDLFTDIDPSHAAYRDLIILYLRGVIKGYSDGSFKPDKAMSREEFVKVNLGAICHTCDRYTKDLQDEILDEYNPAPFPDTNDINNNLLVCVAEAKNEGIVSGYAGGQDKDFFKPTRNISRAEATKVLVETAGFAVEAAKPGEQWYAPYVAVAKGKRLFPSGAQVTDSWLQGNITRAEFVQMAVNLIEVQDCRDLDSDSDGLSDVEEERNFGTSPQNPDTDGGGVPDLTEILEGTDPLDPEDDGDEVTPEAPAPEAGEDEDFSDLADFDHDSGVFVVSDDATYGEISVSTGINGTASLNFFTNEVPADGESTLNVRAEIRDQAGNLYQDDSTSIVEIILSTPQHGLLTSERVLVNRGQAEVQFASSKIAGDVQVEARITNGLLSSEGTEIHVEAGDPVRVDVDGRSTILPVGGEAVNDMKVSLLDQFGNLANNGFYTVTLEGEGGIQLLDVIDENPDLEGTQITTADGFVPFRVLASTRADVGTVKASLPDVPNSGDQFEINHIEGMHLLVTPSQPYMIAGSGAEQTVEIAAVDGQNRALTGFQGDVNLSLSDPAYGQFTVPKIALGAGRGSATLVAGTLAGLGSIIVQSPGLEGGSGPVQIQPAETYELRIRKEDDTHILAAGENARFVIEGYDFYGNLASTDSTTKGTLRATPTTEAFGTLSATQFTLRQGKASFKVQVDEVSGAYNIVATSNPLLAGVWKGEIEYMLTDDFFSKLDPQMLYGSMLGGPFGNTTKENYLGGWLTFNGRTQALTSLVDEALPKKRRAIVDAQGSITIPEDGLLTQTVDSAGTELPLRIQWREFPEKSLIADVFYVVSGLSDISYELLSLSTQYRVDASPTGYVLREDDAAVLKIRNDGQISLLSTDYTLAVSASTQGLGFIVSKGQDQVLHITMNDEWTNDIELLPYDFNLTTWKSKGPGIYVRPTAASQHHFVSVPSGNSSLLAKGLALIDPEELLPEEQQPSLGYQSLESAETTGTIGWEGENKHLLLFAAGNTVGESNLYYPSEVGVVLGDPTVRVEPTDPNALDYTSDVGQLVFASQEDILQLVDSDYNADGMPDVLAAYEDGRIDVLQNADRSTRLKHEGTLLYVENGIRSVHTGDVNGDRMEDLVVVTETSCFAEEMCLYQFVNIGGGYVSKNLSFDEIKGKPKQVQVADLNNDKYDDLVLVDENLKLYVIWNNKGLFEEVDLIKDFGLAMDPGEDLSGDLALHYDGIKNGSIKQAVTLPEDPNVFSPAGGNINDFIDQYSNGEAEIFLDGQDSNGPILKPQVLAFEHADAVSVGELFDVEKTAQDLNEGKAEVGDSLLYSIKVKNRSSQDMDEVFITDSLPGNFRYQTDTFKCPRCSGPNTGLEPQNSFSGRPWTFGPVSLDAGQTLELSYEAKVGSLPKVNVMLGHDFFAYKDDNYLDIAISPEGNNTGTLIVYYSDGVSRGTPKTVAYRSFKQSPDDDPAAYDTQVEHPLGDEDGDGIPDLAEALEGMDPDKGIPVPTSGRDVLKEELGATDENEDGFYTPNEMFSSSDDADGDGLTDLVDQFLGGASLSIDPSAILNGEDFASITLPEPEFLGEIEDMLSAMFCGGGCLGLMGSISFLTPGMLHEPTTGITLGNDQGLPVFGVVGAPPYVCAGSSCESSLVMRLYLSPTTTLGLGMAICLGPKQAGQCFVFNIPLLQALGVCDAINGFISDGMSQATSFISSATDPLSAFGFNASAGFSSNQSSGLSSSSFEGYKPPVEASSNIQVPGFPSIFTEWWKSQKFELFKMLDLPDITFIYPDPKSIAAEFNGGAKKEKVKLEGGVLGLEKFINMAHSLPLIDIKTEPVVINYPSITKEEIEALKVEWGDWVADVKNQTAQYEKTYNKSVEQYKQEGKDIQEDAEAFYGDLITQLQDIISAIEANIETIESYAEIPDQILKIREMESYYAEIIICYLDAILQYTAGYVTENAQRIEAWGKFIKDLQEIIKGWQVLIEASVNMMAACDKCSNQRFSGYQLLISLFAFMPEIPVIELPKLPDIVIDVSDIQAGVDILWPDIQFVPKRLEIPELPPLVLPTATLNLDAGFDVELPEINIPVLPKFDLDYLFPEPPGLPLPELPSLPPAPAIPKLHESVQVSVKIGESVIRIICLLRNGFIPTQESQLKAQVEELTERAGGTVGAFDLASTVEFPPFSLDLLKRVEIITHINLTADFNGLYDVVSLLGDATNELTDGIGDLFDVTIRSVFDLVEDAFGQVTKFSIEEDVNIDAEVDADLSTQLYEDPSMEVAARYIKEPFVLENLTALHTSLVALQDSVDEWDAQMPDSYSLIATERVLEKDDPLLNRYAEIRQQGSLDQTFIAQFKGTPLETVALMRNSLLAQNEQLDKGTIALKNLDGKSFYNYLAQEQNLGQTNVAATTTLNNWSSEDEWKPEELATKQYVAANGVADTPTTGLDFSGAAEAVNKGFYLYDKEAGVSLRLTDYIQEFEEVSHILFMDIDDDGDEDVIYSMGGDVYIKENYKKRPALRYVTRDVEEVTVDQVLPRHGSVYNASRGNNGYQSASFGFDGSAGAIGYEALLYDSLDAQQSDLENNVKRVLLLSETETPSEPYDNASGNRYLAGAALPASSGKTDYTGEPGMKLSVSKGSSFILPDIKRSRLTVNSSGGRLELKDGFKRTLIQNNGELTHSEEVILQTLENTSLTVTVGTDVMNLEVPAFMWVDLGREEDRVIRVESGSAVWIQSEEIVPSQTLVDGMELFPQELVILQGSGAEASLKTTEGVILDLNQQEVFVMDELLNDKQPSVQIELENGAYYTTLYALHKDGQRGTRSDQILLSPQVCADQADPFPIVEVPGTRDSSIDLALFATTEVTAENSFDSDSGIIDIFWDLDATADADGDGIENNDEEVVGHTIDVGPYDTVGEKVVTVWVTDVAGNSSSATVTVNVYVPDLILTEASQTVVKGTSDPLSPEFPYVLVRDRYGVLSELGGQRFTESDGSILADDLVLSGLIDVIGEDGGIVAQFNPVTKQVIVYNNKYEAIALDAEGQWPSRLAVREIASGTIIASFLIVNEAKGGFEQLSKTLETYDLSLRDRVTVHIPENEDRFAISDDEVVLRSELGLIQMRLEATGNIELFDSALELRKKPAEKLSEYLILEVYQGEDLIFQYWPGNPEPTTITTTDELDLPGSNDPLDGFGTDGDFRITFEDIDSDDPLADEIQEFVERGILEGTERDDKRYFEPTDAINRAEFTKIMLGILCIVPRDEAYDLPEVFNDVLSPDAWYFPFTKEGGLRKIITGYLGEKDANGLSPFKPNNTITRAEAAKIFIEALAMEKIIELPKDLKGEPWYKPYMEIAQDLDPYLVNESAGDENFILTKKEAKDPSHVVTRYEFVEMSARVLKAYNCFSLDTDLDGLPNFDEDTVYGTDKYDPDTDNGGVSDGVEVGRGTDPLDADDDFEDTSVDIDPGIYAVNEACLTCPCLSLLDYHADLMKGDKVFAIIRNEEGTVYGRSNTLTVP